MTTKVLNAKRRRPAALLLHQAALTAWLRASTPALNLLSDAAKQRQVRCERLGGPTCGQRAELRLARIKKLTRDRHLAGLPDVDGSRRLHLLRCRDVRIPALPWTRALQSHRRRYLAQSSAATIRRLFGRDRMRAGRRAGSLARQASGHAHVCLWREGTVEASQRPLVLLCAGLLRLCVGRWPNVACAESLRPRIDT